MKITITQATYKSPYYNIYYTLDKEDGTPTADYQVKIKSSYGGFTQSELETKIYNGYILQETGVDFNTNNVIEVQTEPTQLEMDIDLKEEEIKEQNRVVSMIINGIKEDKELYDNYIASESYTTLTAEEKEDINNIFKSKLDEKWKKYKIEKEKLETLKNELIVLES